MKKIGIVNGPNLDRLGRREPEIYGSETLKDLEARIAEEAKSLGVKPVFFQSNHEGALIDWIGNAREAGIAALIINPAALTHTSLALRDALAGCELPAVEVHISNIHRREELRRHSMTAEACTGVISGLGFDGYVAALWFLTQD